MQKFLVLSLMFILLTSCSSTTKNHLAIKGKLIDSETDEPVKNAKVKITLLKPREVFEAHSDESGVFDFSSGETIFVPELFPNDADSKMHLRSVKLIFDHPDFVEDEYDEEIEFVPENKHEIDVGAFYLRPRDKVDVDGNIISNLVQVNE